MIEAGNIVAGTVVACESFGAFIAHDDVRYFVPLHELSWAKLRHASDAVALGEQCKIIVDRPDKSPLGGPLASVRRVKPKLNPWFDPSLYAVGTQYLGPISSKLEYGWFVTHPRGADGLLHSADIPIGFDAALGNEILVEITECNVESEQIRLALSGQRDAVGPRSSGAC